jgi:hypothetical protein
MSPSQPPSHVAPVAAGPPERALPLTGAAILAGSALIAAAIAITFRYSIVPASPLVGAYRLDHWTGETIFCYRPLGTDQTRLDCTAK